MQTQNVRIRDLEDGLYTQVIFWSDKPIAGGPGKVTALLIKLNGRCARTMNGSHVFMSLDDHVNIQVEDLK